MMKCAKKATYAVVGDRDLTDEELITVFAGVESFIGLESVDLSVLGSTRQCSIDP